MKEPNEPAHSENDIPGDIDDGLALAYGGRSSQSASQSASQSVLERIAELTGSAPKLSLREAGTAGETPMLKPLVADDRRESGKYVVHGELGRGGVGAVHRGHDQDLGRDVALKFLHERYKDDAAVVHRFVEEAQIGGQLQHPGIVPVYDIGMSRGKPFFAMKLVKGVTLARRLSDRASHEAERPALLSNFEAVCQTMAYAHARGVVHRDLKPANIMIGSFGEVQVVDWGMGKVLPSGGVDDEARSVERQPEHSVIETARSSGHGSQSITGSIMGTPAYMPPEQARGDVLAMDERSDVFALGALLCEILTGQPPYVGEPEELIQMAAMCRLDGAHSRLAKCGADQVLIDLALECLMPAPAARPDSAGAVAARISEYLVSLEGRAQEAELRATEARYRNRMTVLAASGALLLLAAASGTWLWLADAARVRHDQAMERVTTARDAASRARGEAEAGGHDPQLWASAVAGAAQVVLLCEDDAVDADTRSAAAARLAASQDSEQAAVVETERRARDAAMIERLDVLRIPRLEMPSGDLQKQRRRRGWKPADSAWQLADLRRLDVAYAEAFAGYLDCDSLLEQDQEAALASMRSGYIEPQLATALDFWTLVRDSLRELPNAPDAAATDRLHALASRLDGENSWRGDLRTVLRRASTEGPRLASLASSDDFDELAASDHQVLAEALWRAGEQDAAIAALHRAQQLHPDDFGLCLRLAVTLEKLEEPRFEDAIDFYRIARALRPNMHQLLRLEAAALQRLGRAAEAEQLSRLGSSREPDVAHWIGDIGKALEGQGKDDDALACYRRALELDPSEASAAISLANALAAIGEMDGAIATLGALLEIDPRHAMAHNNLGVYLSKQGEKGQRLEHMQIAVDIEPGLKLYQGNLGKAHADLGDEDEAITCYQRVIDLDPSDSLAHDNLGAALARAGRMEEAITILERSIELAPSNAQAHELLGLSYLSQGDVDRSIEMFERSIELNPNFAKPLNGLGQAYQSLGDLDQAIECYSQALDLNPANAPAHYNLANLHKKRGAYDEATARYREALAIWAPRSDPFSILWKKRAEREILNCRAMEGEQAFLRGDRIPETSVEFNWAALRGCEQKRDQGVVAMVVATFARSPELIESTDWRTYYACRAAARLAASDDPSLDSTERARLRGLARTWLSREIEILGARLGASETEAQARKRLVELREGMHFASMRGTAVESLPEPEREAWRELWSALDDALGAGGG